MLGASTSACPPSLAIDELAALTVRVQAGEDAAWAELHHRLDRYVRKVVVDGRVLPGDVDDVVQLAWVDIVRGIWRLDDPDRLLAWVRTTTTRTAIRWRTRRVGCELPFSPAQVSSVVRRTVVAVDGDVEDPSDLVARRELSARLRTIVEELPPASRALVERLADPAAPTYRELSRELGMPVGSIGPTRQRVLDGLRRRLRSA